MANAPRQQKTAALALGIALLLVFVALGSEAAFNIRWLHPRGNTQIIIFAALSLLVFLLLVLLLMPTSGAAPWARGCAPA
jgi:hypothetical protein